MPDNKDIVDAMLREAAGYDMRRKAAEEEFEAGVDNEDREKYLKQLIKDSVIGKKNALAELEFYGYQAKAPAKRAEQRPAPEPEKRGPGRPRKVT